MGHPHHPPPTSRRRSVRLSKAVATAVATAVAAALGFAGRAEVILRGATDPLRRRAARHGDRGDVPGWVLVTLMTAGLVTALWVLARERLVEVFDRAITSVTG